MNSISAQVEDRQMIAKQFLEGRVMHNQSMVVDHLIRTDYWSEDEIMEVFRPDHHTMDKDKLIERLDDMMQSWWDILSPDEALPPQEYTAYGLTEDGQFPEDNDTEDNVDILESILGDDPIDAIHDALADYLNDNYEEQEVFEWYLVDGLAHLLRDKGEIILSDGMNSWWGRTCTGQSVYMDYVMQQIAQEYNQ